jgi:uncharacterized protein YihD (DUF1040 family)
MTMLEKAARALEAAAFGYNMNLVRLVDGVSTYELRYSDSDEVYTFNGTDEAYEHVAERKRMTQARAVLAAIREPDEAMLSAAYGDAIVGHGAAYTAMIDAILEGESK